MKVKKEKKPKDINKLLTQLAIITTIVLAIVVSFFMLKDQANQIEAQYTDLINVINKLNQPFNESVVVDNAFSEQDLISLKQKCELSGWDLFENNSISTTKYNNLNSADGSLSLTEKECGVLLNGVLNITGNPNSIIFKQLTLSKSDNSNRIDYKFVYKFSFKSVLSIDEEMDEAFKEANINFPNTVCAISTGVYDTDLSANIITNITYNNLDLNESELITNLLNAGKEQDEDNIENFAIRLLIAMNYELNTKTDTITQFINGGLEYKK